MENQQTISGRPVEVHYIACFNEDQQIIGDALQLMPPARIEVQMVGNKFGFQLWMPTPEGIGIHVSDPHIVGIGLFDVNMKFLTGLSIPGHPAMRKKDELFILRSRYIVLAPK